MKKPPSVLFKTRSATNEFLVSSSDKPANKRDFKDTRLDESRESKAESLAGRFTDILDPRGLSLAVENEMGDCIRFSVVAARIQSASSIPVLLEEMLAPAAGVCRDHNGLWAFLDDMRLAFVLPDLDARAAREATRKMQKSVGADVKATLTAGLATFPTGAYSRLQTIENAEKALDHADFFEPGKITDFDAVSLNISGDRRYQAGDIRGAMEEFNQGLRMDPCDTNLLNSLGVCHGVLEEYGPALKAFVKAARLAPDEMMPVYNQGFVYLRQGQTRQALDAFLAADALEPGVFEVVFHIGQVYMDQAEHENARPYLESAVRANSRSAAAYRLLGDCLDPLGLTKEAIQAYKAVVKINPRDAAALSLLGRLYVKRGESLDVAAVFCEQSVRIAPDDGLFRHRLGYVYLEQDKSDLALAEFERAAALGYDSQAMIAEAQDRMLAAKAS
jgi:tetratricopeptide (TPR) repeat protein